MKEQKKKKTTYEKRYFYSVCKAGTVTLRPGSERENDFVGPFIFDFSFKFFVAVLFSSCALIELIYLQKCARTKVLILRIYPFRISCYERNQVFYFRVFDISCTKTKNREGKNNRTKTQTEKQPKAKKFFELLLPPDFNAAHHTHTCVCVCVWFKKHINKRMEANEREEAKQQNGLN